MSSSLRKLPLYCLIFIGLLGTAIFATFAFIDWLALEKAYAQFSLAAENSTDLSALFVAHSSQNIHRINLFAEGVWTLLRAILAAIGFHGLATAPRKIRKSSNS